MVRNAAWFALSRAKGILVGQAKLLQPSRNAPRILQVPGRYQRCPVAHTLCLPTRRGGEAIRLRMKSREVHR